MSNIEIIWNTSCILPDDYLKLDLSVSTTTEIPFGSLKEGEYIHFGSCPQSIVTDSTVLSALAKFDSSWTSYKYYLKGNEEDFMFYMDFTLGSEKYRGVYFTQLRPKRITGDDRNTQDFSYDFAPNTYYCFKYEPIKWKVVKVENGQISLVAEKILDSQNYNTKIDTQFKSSSIIKWLNDHFFKTAFNDFEKDMILCAQEQNNLPDDLPTHNDSGPTKIFLLSYSEAYRLFSSSEDRKKVSTDYAKIQGLQRNRWWTRANSSESTNPSIIDEFGLVSTHSFSVDTTVGVVPAIVITLPESSTKVENEEIDFDVDDVLGFLLPKH